MEPRPSPNSHEHCLTCSDEAVVVRVTRLLPFELAMVDTACGGEAEEISVALVDAEVGDRVLVHAKEALAVLSQGTASLRPSAPTSPAVSAPAPAPTSPAVSVFTSAALCAVRGAVDEVYEMGGAFEIGAPGEAG